MYTFQSCPMNFIYSIEDDDWTKRECEQCQFTKPFSFGFNNNECKACSEIEPILTPEDDPYLSFFYRDACVKVEEVDEEEERDT